MAYGISTTGLSNPLLNVVRGVSLALPGTYIQLHIGDPGAIGTANLSSNTTRNSALFAAASGGALALSAAPAPWNMGTTETVAAISVWSAATSGTFYWSCALTTPQAVNNGDTLTLNTCGLSIGPLAA